MILVVMMEGLGRGRWAGVGRKGGERENVLVMFIVIQNMCK